MKALVPHIGVYLEERNNAATRAELASIYCACMRTLAERSARDHHENQTSDGANRRQDNGPAHRLEVSDRGPHCDGKHVRGSIGSRARPVPIGLPDSYNIWSIALFQKEIKYIFLLKIL